MKDVSASAETSLLNTSCGEVFHTKTDVKNDQ